MRDDVFSFFLISKGSMLSGLGRVWNRWRWVQVGKKVIHEVCGNWIHFPPSSFVGEVKVESGTFRV